MARGVQQEDVSLAADAVLKSGARPTVERVRKQMGRGSPNTVGPLLDIWFSQLGTRLGENPALLPSPSPAADVPLAVINASKLVWTTARTEAQREAAGAVAGDRQALATEREDLEQERSAFHASREAMEENIRLAQGQAADLRRQVDDLAERGRQLQDLLDQALARCGHLEAELRGVHQELASARRQLDEQARQHAEERARGAERSAASERHHLQEIDRAREEARKARDAAQEATASAREARAKADADRAAWEDREQDLLRSVADRDRQIGEGDKKLLASQSELARATDALAASQRLAEAQKERVLELAEALAAQRRTEEDLRRQLAAAAPSPAAKRPARRKP